MSVHPFAGFNPKPSAWGYNWTVDEVPKAPLEPIRPQHTSQVPNAPQSCSPEPEMMASQLANMPAALINSLKREKKPFTYTPGGVNLNEVLSARLLKRMERKKKYSEERAAEDLPRFDPPRQVIVMSTHNTPLDMYSMENAIEALEVQAALVSNDQSLSGPSRSATLPRNHTFRFDEKDMDPGRGVSQSRAFKVLQIITDTEEESTGRGRDQHHDEMRFTGIRDSKSIPSRFFHTLQKITGTEDDEEEDPHQQQQPRQMQIASQPPTQKIVSNVQPQQSFQQPASNRVVPQMPVHEQPSNTPGLKRPAAFLPIKTTPGAGFRHVQPSFLANGSIKRSLNRSAVTDF